MISCGPTTPSRTGVSGAAEPPAQLDEPLQGSYHTPHDGIVTQVNKKRGEALQLVCESMTSDLPVPP